MTTIEEALNQYARTIDSLLKRFPDEEEDIKNKYSLVLSDKWKMSAEEIEQEQNDLNLKYPNDIVNFKKEIGNFQIGEQEEDGYGNYNRPVFGFMPLLEWWGKSTELEDEFSHSDEGFDVLTEKLSRYIIFFGEINCIDSVHYCLDTATRNKESNEMNIEQFHQDSWYPLAMNEVETCEEDSVFEKFVIEFIDEKIEFLKKEF